MGNGQITAFVLESLVGHLEKFYSPAFYPRSTVGILMLVVVVLFPSSRRLSQSDVMQP